MAALPPFTEGAHHGLLHHPRQRKVVHTGMREEALVLGGQDGLAQDGRHLVVGHDVAVLAGQLDEDPSVGIIDKAGRRGGETDERLEIGEAAAVEVDVVHEPRAWEQDRRGDRERDGEEQASAPCRGPQRRGQTPRRAKASHEPQTDAVREGLAVCVTGVIEIHGNTPSSGRPRHGSHPLASGPCSPGPDLALLLDVAPEWHAIDRTGRYAILGVGLRRVCVVVHRCEGRFASSRRGGLEADRAGVERPRQPVEVGRADGSASRNAPICDRRFCWIRLTGNRASTTRKLNSVASAAYSRSNFVWYVRKLS